MAYLQSMVDVVGGATGYVKDMQSALDNPINKLTSVALKGYVAAGNELGGTNPLADKIAWQVGNSADIASRTLQGSREHRHTLPLMDVWPGFMGIYREGKLRDILSFQFEAKVTSDSRSAGYDTKDFGVNYLSTYKMTELRKIALTTYFATIDPWIYSSAYVEKKIRQMQSLVYVSDPEKRIAGDKEPQYYLNAPPIIGLFIGDKFLRRRLPRIKFDIEENSVTKFTIEKEEEISTSFTNVEAGINQMLKDMVIMEPIYWRVDSVEVDWEEAPVNIDFSEWGINAIPWPGKSKLPMFQRVTLNLTEHRTPNTYERASDVSAYSTPNNFIHNALMT